VSVDLGVAQAGEQPGARVLTVDAVQTAPSAQECLLDQVLGVCGLAGDGGRDAQHDRDLRQDDTVVTGLPVGAAGSVGCRL
jgi:hypothetical protein